MKVYLDDVRTPVSNEWRVVRDYKEFAELVLGLTEEQQKELEVSFDHDLGNEYHYTNTGTGPSDYVINYDDYKRDKTGYDCAQLLVDYDILPKMFWVHSANLVGAENILGLLNNWYRHHDISTRGYRTSWEFTA